MNTGNLLDTRYIKLSLFQVNRILMNLKENNIKLITGKN